MIRPDYRSYNYSNELYHYGMPRRSGRYKWGSGKRPYQTNPKKASEVFKEKYEKAKPAIAKAAKVGVKIAASIALSTALGTVGNLVVQEALNPAASIGVATLTKAGTDMAKSVVAKEAASRVGKTVASVSRSVIMGPIGDMKVQTDNKDDHKNANERSSK